MVPNGNALFFGCYDYNEEWLLIEMQVDTSWKWIRWNKFEVPQNGINPSDWQVPYLEQYLNNDGTEKICDLYCNPKENTAPCRFAFFLYKTDAPKLICQFGEFDLTNPKVVPNRLLNVVAFESEDDY